VADALEITNQAMQQQKAQQDYQTKMTEIAQKNQIELEKIRVAREKLQVDRDNQKNDLAVAKANAKGRTNKKK